MNSSLPFPNSPVISPKWFDHIMQTKKDKWAKLILIYNMDNCPSTHSSVPLKRHVTNKKGRGGGGTYKCFPLGETTLEKLWISYCFEQ
jgi:hypothetical protein